MDKRLFAIPVILLFGLAILFSGLMGGFMDDPTDDSVEPEMPSVGEPEFVMQKADSTPAAESEPEVVVEEAPEPAPTMGGMGGGMSSAPASTAPSTPAPAAAAEGTGDEGTGDEGTGDEGTGDEGTGDEGTASVARGADVCPDGDVQVKFEGDTGVDFGNVSIGDTFTLPIPDSTGSIEIEITAVKDADTSGIGEAMAFNWTSDEPVCFMLVKAGDGDSGWIEVGATSGTGTTPNTAAISHITFCFGCGGGTGQEIPEFPTIALPMLAIIGMAFFFNRRK